MPAGRRHPPPLPHLSALVPRPTGPQGKQTPESVGLMYNGLLQALRKQEEFNRSMLDGFSGLPAPHADTHLVGKSDPLQTPGVPLTVLAGGAASIGTGPSFMRENAQLIVGVAAPANPTGQTAALGSATTVLRSDCVVKQGIVTTKGDLLTHNATLPDRLAVGADGLALVANSGTATGLSWAAPAAAAHNLLSTTHGDTVAGAAVKGTLVVGNTTPAWDRLAVGTDGHVLTADSTQALGVKWAAGGGGGGPWTNTGTTVHLVTSTDQVKIGGAATVIDGALHVFCAGGTRHITVADHGASANPLLRMRSSRGTETVPTDTSALGDVLGRIETQGYESGYATAGVLQFTAGTGWSAGQHGSRATLQLVPNGQTTLRDALNVSCVVGGSNGFEWIFNRPAGDTPGISIGQPFRFHQHVPSSGAFSVINMIRSRSDAAARTAGFGGYLSMHNEGFTTDQYVEIARLTWLWENDQNNDTTDRDSAMLLSTMVNNTLTERMRITSAGVVQPGADNVGDLGSTAFRWKDAYIVRGILGEPDPTSAGTVLTLASEAAGDHFVYEAVGTSVPAILRFNRARGSLGALSDLNASDVIGQLGFYGRKSSYSEAARLTVDCEGVTNQAAGRFTFATRPDLAMGGVLTTRLVVSMAGNVVVGSGIGGIATTATDGFLYIPSCAGTPTGVPTTYTGSLPIVYDSTNLLLYIYVGGAWTVV